MKHEPFNESFEMYLKTIRELSAKYDPVPIATVAERLGISSVSANEMMHRLKDRGLITYTPYKGVALTDDGLQYTRQIIRRHRLWECFLVDKLEIAWEQVHDFACRIEHAVGAEVTNALAAYLEYPETCPHGNPIPYDNESAAERLDTPLSEFSIGQSGVIERVHPESNLVLDYLAARGLKPGLPVQVVEIAPFKGPITVSAGQQVHTLGREVAAYIYLLVEEENQTNEPPSITH